MQNLPRGLLIERLSKYLKLDPSKSEPSYSEIEEMQKDATVSYCFFLVTLPIRRTRFIFEHPSKEIADFVNLNLARIRRTITQDSLSAFLYGWAPFEKRFERIGRLLYFKEFFPLKPSKTEVRLKRGSFDGLTYKPSFWQEVNIPAAKSFVITHEWRFRNYYGRSLLEGAYLPWLMKKETMRLHAIAMTDTAVPPVVGRAPEGMGKYEIEPGQVREIEHREMLGIMLSTMRSRGWFVLPPKGPNGEWTFETLETSGSWRFADDYEIWERQIALALLVPREIFREGGGSYAKAKEQSFWFARTAEALLQEVADFVHSFAIMPLLRLNFAEANRPDFPRGRLLFENISSRDIEFLQNAAIKMLDSLSIDWDAVLQILRVPVRFEEPQESKRTVKSRLKDAAIKSIQQIKERLNYDGYIPLSSDLLDKINAEAERLQRLSKSLSPQASVLAFSEARRKLISEASLFAVEYIAGVRDGSGTDQEAA